ncbi:MAG: hypothetical protein ACRYFV_20400 [Janthinobacterium lividum]
MGLLDKYKQRTQQQLESEFRRVSSEENELFVMRRGIAEEDLAYRKVYEAWFGEAVPERENGRDACFFKSLHDTYDDNGIARDATDVPTFQDRLDTIEEAARQFGRKMLYHSEFIAYFALDVSECSLFGKEVEAMLNSVVRPQLQDSIDVDFVLMLLDEALAEPSRNEYDSYLLAMYEPNTLPPLQKLQLERAKAWLKQITGLPAIASTNESVSPKKNLGHRQIALLEFYMNRPITNLEQATILAQQHQLGSGERLLKKYREISESTGITGVAPGGIKSMIKDLLIVKGLLADDKIYKLDIHLRTLKGINSRTGLD